MSRISAAFLSLARTQRKLAHENRRRKNMRESRRLWTSAKWNLRQARVWKGTSHEPENHEGI